MNGVQRGELVAKLTAAGLTYEAAYRVAGEIDDDPDARSGPRGWVGPVDLGRGVVLWLYADRPAPAGAGLRR